MRTAEPLPAHFLSADHIAAYLPLLAIPRSSFLLPPPTSLPTRQPHYRLPTLAYNTIVFLSSTAAGLAFYPPTASLPAYPYLQHCSLSFFYHYRLHFLPANHIAACLPLPTMPRSPFLLPPPAHSCLLTASPPTYLSRRYGRPSFLPPPARFPPTDRIAACPPSATP